VRGVVSFGASWSPRPHSRATVRSKKRRFSRSPKNRHGVPRTAKQSRDAQLSAGEWDRATKFISEMRRTALPAASFPRDRDRVEDCTALVGKALRKQRMADTPSDRPTGSPGTYHAHDTRTEGDRHPIPASKSIVAHSNAVNRYLTTGDASALHEFDGKKIKTARKYRA